MKLESGPASADRNYWVFVALLCIGFAAYFVYDGARGWPEENRNKAREHFEQINAEPPELGETPTQELFLNLKRAQDTDADSVRRALGEPVLREQAAGRIVERYVSLYGMVTLVIRNGRVEWNESQWTLWYKTKAAIDAQFYWACIPGLIGLYGAFRAYKAATLRVTIDQEGMIYAGRRIAFADMVSLRDYSKKGWVDLYHKGAGGQETKRRLDNQKVDKFEEIIEIICQVKDFDNPLHVEDDDEAPSEHDAPAGEGDASSVDEEPAESPTRNENGSTSGLDADVAAMTVLAQPNENGSLSGVAAGNSASVLVCPNERCGHRNNPDASVCARCGNELNP